VADRDDVVQDVLLNLSKAMGQFEYDPSKSFRAWLKTVTKHAVATSVKRAKRQGVGQGGTAMLRLVQSIEAENDLAERVQRQYEIELAQLAVLRLRMRIKPRTWDAFRMLIDGRTGGEVASELGMTVVHVYVVRNEVTAALRKEILRLEPENKDHDQGRIQFKAPMPD
ncbi:MAG: sigma-70 family RNA polymerase sigma factor, partial [Rubripirellula sp.]